MSSFVSVCLSVYLFVCPLVCRLFLSESCGFGTVNDNDDDNDQD